MNKLARVIIRPGTSMKELKRVMLRIKTSVKKLEGVLLCRESTKNNETIRETAMKKTGKIHET